MKLKRKRYFVKEEKGKSAKVVNIVCGQARRQDLGAGGGKNQKGGPHFKNTVLDVCSNRGAKREMGGHRFQMGGPGITAPPRWRRPACGASIVRNSVEKMIGFASRCVDEKAFWDNQGCEDQ